MTKRSALGSSFLVGAYDLSGDIGAVGNITSSQATQDVSSIRSRGTERLSLRKDGAIGYTSFWNPSSAQAVPVLSDIGGGQVQVTVIKGPGGLGAYAASLIAVRADFVTASGQDGSLGATGNAMGAAGVPTEWGRIVTADVQTFATTQAIDAWDVDTVYATDDLIVPTTPNGHYYKATPGGTSDDDTEPTWPTNGTTVADGPDTLVWTDQGLLPNGIERGVGSASNFGAAAYLHVTGITSGNAAIKVQDSADRVAWDDVPGLAFSTVTAIGAQRVETGATENVRRYVRAYLTGTFVNLKAAVNVVVYRIATI